MKSKLLNAFVIALILFQAVAPIGALAYTGTDQSDYGPGATVIISGDNSDGAGFVARETVQVDVSGPGGFSDACQATADENGVWFCRVTLPADAADGSYTYVAHGETASQSGGFTVTAPATPVPTQEPTQEPTVEPTQAPTEPPTAEPTQPPTTEPTQSPTAEPTSSPTLEPTASPTATQVVTPTAPPFIRSDKEDYSAGELVTLTSGNWQAGESVHIIVNDTIGNTWVHTTDITADYTGAFVYQFDLPDWFVAQYHVYAYGAASGATTWDFTDARSERVFFAGTGGGSVVISVDAGSISYATSGAGNCNATGSGTGTSTVTLTGTCTTLSTNVNGANVTITATANGTSYFAGYSGGVNGFSSCSSNATCGPVVLPGGQNDVTVNFTAKTTITPSFSASNKTYDGNTTASVSFTGFTPSVGGDNVSVTWSSATFANKNVGTGKTVTISGLTLTGTDANKYALSSTTATTTANITAKALTVSGITAGSKVYDGNTTATLNTGSAALVGAVLGDSVTLNTGSATGAFVNKTVGTGKTVNVSGLTISGTDAGNYTLTQPTTTADITAKNLTVTGITASNKTYDGNTTATLNTGSAALDGVVSGDTVSLNTGSTSGTFSDKNVGTGRTVTVSGLTISGTDSTNYSLTQPTTTADITAKALTGSITVDNKGYDGTTAATIAAHSLSGVVGLDDVNYVAGTATFDTKNVGTSKTVTATGLSLSGTDAGNYTVNSTATTTADITARTLNIVAHGVNKVYDGTAAATVTFTDDRQSGDVVNFTYSASFADKNAGTSKTVSVTGIALTGADAENYSLASTTASTSADITPRPLAVSAMATGKTYDGTNAASVSLSDDRLVGDLFTVNYTLATFSDKNVGMGKTVTVSGISLSGTDAGNYTPNATALTTANITARDLTVTAAGNDKVYDSTTDATVDLATDAVSGDDVTAAYTSASFADKNVGMDKPVSVSGISISGGDAGNYNLLNTTASTTADIAARALLATAHGVNKIYDGSATATVTFSDDRASGDNVTVNYTSASFADKNVGTDKAVSVSGISLSGPDAGNYAVNTTASTSADITARALTVFATGVNKVYDGTTAANVNLSTNEVSGDSVSATYTSATFADKNVAMDKPISVTGISISGTDAGNYTFNATASASADITPRVLTVSATGNDKVYDGTAAATVNLATDEVSGDDIFASYTTASFDDKNVGTDKPVSVSGISISGGDASNYTFNATASASADITARDLHVTATASNKVYNGSTTASVTLSNDRVSGDSLIVTYVTANFDTRNVGTNKTVTVIGISISGTEAGNYNLVNTSTTAAADITPRDLTVTTTGNDKVYDGTAAATVDLSTDKVAGDDVTAAYTSASFADKNVGTDKPVSVSDISISGGDASNYTLTNTTASTTANITQYSLLITATGHDKIYDGTTDATVALSDNRVSGDDITTTYDSAAFDTKNVGMNKPVSVSGISISGPDAGNYAYNDTATTTANITARDLTVSATADSKTYDATTAAVAHLSNNRVSGDDVTAAHTSATFDNKNVGTNKTVTVNGISIAGDDANNYNLLNTSATATADITAASITASITADNKVYDGTTDASFTCDVASILGMDEVSCTGGSASFDDKTAGTGKTVTATGFSLSGIDADNYLLSNSSATDTADITARPLTISATGINKVYDGNTTASVSLSDDRVSGDVFTGSYTSAAFNNKNVGTAKPVSVSGISISGADAGNYTFNTTASTTADITPRALVVSATGINKTYDGTAAASVSLSDDRVSGDVLILGYGSAAFDNKNVGTGKPVSVNGITVTGTDSGNYTFNSSASTTADITALAITGSITAQSKVYDGTTAAAIFTRALSGQVSGDDVNYVGGTATFDTKNVGNAKLVTATGLSLSGADAVNYTVNTSATTTADITPLAIIGSITAQSKVYDSTTAAIILTRTLSGQISGDDVTYDGGTATFSDKSVGNGKTVTATGLSLIGSDAGNYTVNDTAIISADITPLAIIGSITADNKVYDGNANATIATRTLSGVLSGDVVSYVGGTAVFNNKNVGTVKPVSATGLSLSGTDAGNYTVNSTASTTADITQLAITGSITANNKVYDGNDNATIATRSLTGSVSADDVSYVGGTATFDTKDVGTDKTVTAIGLSLSGTDAGNYTVNSTASTLANVTARDLHVSVTASNKVYDGNTNAAVNLSIDKVSGDVVSVSLTSAAFTDKNVGTGKTINVSGISIGGTDAGNYNLVNTTASTTADITARPLTITATGVNKVYDATTSATVTLSDNRVSGDIFTDSYITAAFADKNVGIGKSVSVSGISISGTDAGNYTFNTATSTTADITARALHVTATGINKVYDGNTGATVTLGDDRVSGDVFTASYTAANFADKNVGTGKSVSVSGISISGTDAGNYTFNTTASTTADITARPLTVSATGVNRVYDGTTVATVNLSDNRVASDSLSVSYGSATFGDKNVGNAKPISVSGISISGGDADNYTFNTTASATADITARPLTVSATGVNKVYDGSNTATVMLNDNRVSGDDITPTYGSAAFDTKNVGTGKPVSVNGISISGPDAGNYTFNTSATTSANITQRGLTVSATGVNKVYDGNTTAAVNLSTDKLPSDTVSASYTSADFNNKNVGTGKPVSVGGISISGADAGNYNLLNTTASTTADITARPVTITADAKTKVYGDGDPALTYQVTGGSVVLGDNFSGALNRLAGENVGSYAINQNTVTLGSNYALSYVGANLTITRATLTVTADNKSIFYGSPDPIFTFTYSGFKFSDNATVIDTAPTCTVPVAHTAVGSYYIVCSGGSDNNYQFGFVNGVLTIAAWHATGFYQPVDMNNVVNTVKGGSTVPLKFELFAGTTELTSVSAVQPLTYVEVSCTSLASAAVDEIETLATGGTSLRYDTTGGQFIYNWKTPTGAGHCYRVTMTSADGVTKLIAYFKTK